MKLIPLCSPRRSNSSIPFLIFATLDDDVIYNINLINTRIGNDPSGLSKEAIIDLLERLGVYNDFYNPFLYMPDRNLKVISTALFAFKGPYGTNWPVILAGVVIVILPILIVFLSLQKYIYNGVAGSVK